MAKPLLIKTIKRIILGLVGVAVLAGMFWYINTYIYQFYASSPTVNVDSSNTIATVTEGDEFNVVIRFANHNIETVDLVLTFDKDKLSYQNAVSSLPANYFKNPPDYYKVTDAGANKSQLRLILLANSNVQRANALTVNLRFKALKSGITTVAVDKDSVIAGIDASNKAVNFEEDLTKASRQIVIEAPQGPTATPIVTVQPTVATTVAPTSQTTPTVTNVPSVTTQPTTIPTPTPPWQNTNYTTTTVFGIVQDADEGGIGIAGKYWRKDNTVCANATYPSSAQMNISGNYIDKCQGFNNLPYFLTVVNNPGSNIAYQLQNIPEGYECVSWEHRLRIKSDGSPFTKAEGTGCTTGPLEIVVNNATSSYENSHLLWFKIRRVVEPTPTSPLEQYESVLNMSVKFQGIQQAPREQYRKLGVNVILKGGGQSVKEQLVEFTAQPNGTWTGALGVDGINAATKYELILKGAKHLAKKICENTPSEQLGGTYRCTDANINLQKGENTLNFSGIILLGGDLPQQDGIINALDFAFVRQNLGSQSPEDLIRGDINLDGIIDTQDHTAIKTALEFKYDEE